MTREPTRRATGTRLGRVRSKSFKTKAEARGFLASAENAKQRGDWTDPRGGKIRFEDYATEYLGSVAHLRPGTRQKIEGHLRNQIYPFFDKTPLGAIKPAHIRSWIAALEKEGLAPGTINGIYRTFSKIMKTALIDGLISRSPCIGIDLPKQTSHEEMKFLDPDQVEALAEAIDPRFRALIYTAAYTGMRWGELAALKIERLNLLTRDRRRRRVDVGDQRVSRGPTDEDGTAQDALASSVSE